MLYDRHHPQLKEHQWRKKVQLNNILHNQLNHQYILQSQLLSLGIGGRKQLDVLPNK